MRNRLKELRRLHQLSQADLASKLVVSRQAINGFESGKFDPSLDMAFRIASLLNVKIEDIFIYEAKNPMQTLVRQVTDFLGLEFGFERFTDKAINVINYARNEAKQTENSQVTPEHLFAGLLADSTTKSARLLGASGAKYNLEIDESYVANSQKIKLNSESKFILELALQVVRLNDEKSIDTEHILWGLVRLAETRNTNVKDLLQQYEVDLTALNQQLAVEI